MVVFTVVCLIAALVIGITNGDKRSPAASGSRTESTLDETTPVYTTVPTSGTTGDGLDPEALAAGEVMLEAVGTDIAHSFTETAAVVIETAPAVSLPVLPLPSTTAPLPQDQVALSQIPGGQPGLYGGTRDMAACDKEKLISFLEANPDKATAWSGVQGIAPSAIRSYIGRLTPVVLTKDTRVTNHGFRNGLAQPHPSVLQAGHAVLVDEFGVPRAKCSCGNPLLPPQPVSVKPAYVGPAWPGFSTTTIVVVIATVVVPDGFVIVDLSTGALITRPVGFGPGSVDTPVAADTVCDLFPDDPSCVPPATDPVELVNVGNIGGIVPGAASSPSFTVGATTLVTYIQTYHYGSGSVPGQLGLQGADGSFYGPFQADGLDGQGGMPNAYWFVGPDLVIPAGTYMVWDSEPSTWSTNAEAGMVGFAMVEGIVGVDQPPVDPGTPPEVPATLDRAALSIVDMLLLDCGYNVTEWTDGGSIDNGWVWSAVIADAQRTFVVHDPFAAYWVEVRDQPSADLAVACGFYQP